MLMTDARRIIKKKQVHGTAPDRRGSWSRLSMNRRIVLIMTAQESKKKRMSNVAKKNAHVDRASADYYY